ncbi:MAG TPA: threonine aldolase [Planctomycetaceae bacterium]|nr:threonine aldolase [Planctomycetaceae bacterium]
MHHKLNDPSELITPCLLVYPDRVRNNIQECIRIAGGPDRLRPHVKTHKCRQIVELELEMGITRHKCATLAEAEMLAEAGAKDVFIAYPQVGPAINRLLTILAKYTKTEFCVAIESVANATQIDSRLGEVRKNLDVLVDVDIGMHRTGVPVERALDVCRAVAAAKQLRFRGLHAYDGHNHLPKLVDRQDSVRGITTHLSSLTERLSASGLECATIVCGGTPTFPVFAQVEIADVSIELSPGTCILNDFGYSDAYRDMNGFEYAAILMTRVVSKQHSGHVTLDLGHKAVAGDPPAGRRCHFLDIDAVEGKQNEEHLVIQTPAAERLELGDVLYVVPTHICPTVALHSEMQVVKSGQVAGSWPVAARHRIYR